MKKRGLVFLMIAVAVFVVVALKPVDSHAATKKMTAYSTIKSGNTVYCTSGWHILKVDLKTKKVTKLAKSKVIYCVNLKIKGKYLYYVDKSTGVGDASIYRINLKTNKKKKLAGSTGSDYVISGSKIYYQKWDRNKPLPTNRTMKLNGKAKKKTKVRIKMTNKDTNTKNYSVYSTEPNDSDPGADFYLATPDGDIFLIHEDVMV